MLRYIGLFIVIALSLAGLFIAIGAWGTKAAIEESENVKIRKLCEEMAKSLDQILFDPAFSSNATWIENARKIVNQWYDIHASKGRK